MLSVLRESFEVAEYFIDQDLANFQFQNKNQDRVYDIVRDLKINKSVQEFLTNQYNKMQDRGQVRQNPPSPKKQSYAPPIQSSPPPPKAGQTQSSVPLELNKNVLGKTRQDVKNVK